MLKGFSLFFSFILLGLAWESAAFSTTQVGIVLDKGGRKDRSFNESALTGLSRAEKELAVKAKDVVASDDTSYESLLTRFVRKKYDLVVGVGFGQKQAIEDVAKKFPKAALALVDAVADAPNVKSLMFAEHEGSFLAGVVAAMKSRTAKVGFIGGMDIPLIRRFALGYEAGVKHVNPKATVVVNYIGVTGTAWNDPARAKELALSQFDSGVDIVFAAAGASGSGVFDAVEEKSKRTKKPFYAIGVDSNQNWIKPGMILTSMVKKVDVAVFEAVKEVKAGSFKGGVTYFDLANGGVELAVDQHNKDLLGKDVLAKVDEVKKAIIAKQITVPDYYKNKK